LSNNTRSSQSIGTSIRTAYKKWPSVYVGYTKGFNQFKGMTSTKFETNSFDASLDYGFLPSWTFKADYNYFQNNNITTNQKTDYQLLNFSLDYQKEKNPWGFNFAVNNVLNNNTKIHNSISDFLI